MKVPVTINARSLSQPQTGVQRFSREIITRLEQRVRLLGKGVPANSIVGTLWEQLILPQYISRNEILFSPANTGPLQLNNQVLVIHDLSVIDHPEWYSLLFRNWYRFLIPRLASRVKKVITGSQFSRNKILELLRVSDEQVVVIPYGVSEYFYPRSAEEIASMKIRLQLPDRYFLFVGSIQRRKNLRGLF